MANSNDSFSKALEKYQANIGSDDGGFKSFQSTFEQESSKQENILKDINLNTKKVSENVNKSNQIINKGLDKNLGGILDKFGGLSRMISKDLNNMTDPKKQGSFTKALDRFLGFFRNQEDVFSDPIEALVAINGLVLNELKLVGNVIKDGLFEIGKISNQTVNRLDDLISIIFAQISHYEPLVARAIEDGLKRLQNLGDNTKLLPSPSNIEKARGLVDGKEEGFAKNFFKKFEGMFDLLIKNPEVKSASEFIGSTYKFLDNIGKAGKSLGGKWLQRMADWGWVAMMLSPLKKLKGLFGFFTKIPGISKALNIISKIGHITKIIPLLARIAALIGGIGGFMGAIIGSAVFAIVYNAIKNPNVLAEYMGIFGDFFGMMKDAFAYLATEVFPPIGVALAAVGVVCLKLLDIVGGLLNMILIPILKGVMILIKGIGRVFKVIWDTFMEVIYNILGIFGVGKYKDKGFLTILLDMMGAFWAFPAKLVGALIDTAADLFNWGNWMGLGAKGEETFTAKMGKIFWNMIDGIGDWFSGLVDGIKEWFKSAGDWISIMLVKSVIWVVDFIKKWNIISVLAWTIGGIFNAIGDAFKGIKDWFNSFFEEKSLFGSITGFFGDLWDTMTSWIPSMDDIKNYIWESMPNWLKWSAEKTGLISKADITEMDKRIIAKESRQLAKTQILEEKQMANAGGKIEVNNIQVNNNTNNSSSMGHHYNSAPQTRRNFGNVGVQT